MNLEPKFIKAGMEIYTGTKHGAEFPSHVSVTTYDFLPGLWRARS
jgi:hypothetical protein